MWGGRATTTSFLRLTTVIFITHIALCQRTFISSSSEVTTPREVTTSNEVTTLSEMTTPSEASAESATRLSLNAIEISNRLNASSTSRFRITRPLLQYIKSSIVTRQTPTQSNTTPDVAQNESPSTKLRRQSQTTTERYLVDKSYVPTLAAVCCIVGILVLLLACLIGTHQIKSKQPQRRKKKLMFHKKITVHTQNTSRRYLMQTT
ncbi:hypothetical protein EB796_006349 [Bugula neritina]|uniref:Uncharacterized protein n=1 Tax=Bugula neritina TaxID=10212 RepID=A0A7J7KBX7_BUGNE|nr:hypothetical protein EB796_006349 [Bugula neritina]